MCRLGGSVVGVIINESLLFPVHPNKLTGASGGQKQAKVQSSLLDVQWEWQGDVGWKAYDSPVSEKVTEAMCAGEEAVVVQVRVTTTMLCTSTHATHSIIHLGGHFLWERGRVGGRGPKPSL